MEYELAYYDSAVHRFNNYTTRTPADIFLDLCLTGFWENKFNLMKAYIKINKRCTFYIISLANYLTNVIVMYFGLCIGISFIQINVLNALKLDQEYLLYVIRNYF